MSTTTSQLSSDVGGTSFPAGNIRVGHYIAMNYGKSTCKVNEILYGPLTFTGTDIFTGESHTRICTHSESVRVPDVQERELSVTSYDAQTKQLQGVDPNGKHYEMTITETTEWWKTIDSMWRERRIARHRAVVTVLTAMGRCAIVAVRIGDGKQDEKENSPTDESPKALNLDSYNMALVNPTEYVTCPTHMVPVEAPKKIAEMLQAIKAKLKEMETEDDRVGTQWNLAEQRYKIAKEMGTKLEEIPLSDEAKSAIRKLTDDFYEEARMAESSWELVKKLRGIYYQHQLNIEGILINYPKAPLLELANKLM